MTFWHFSMWVCLTFHLNLLSVETSWLPSARAASTDFQQEQTSPLPKETSLTTTFGSIIDTPTMTSVSAISSTSSVAYRLSVIAKLVPNTGNIFIANAYFIPPARLNLYIPLKLFSTIIRSAHWDSDPERKRFDERTKRKHAIWPGSHVFSPLQDSSAPRKIIDPFFFVLGFEY